MNTKVAWIAVIVIVALALLWFFTRTNQVPEPAADSGAATATSTEAAVTAPEEEATEEVMVVTLTDTGFTPATITIAVGDTVRFVNESSRSMWVGADEHPTHTEYDGTSTREHCVNGAAVGGTFDQCAATARGSSYEFTFTKAGTFGYHNHAGASSVGAVIVR